VAIRGSIAEGNLFAIGGAEDGGTLDMGDINLERVSEPGDPLALEHAGLVDFTTVGIGFDGTIGELLAKDVALIVLDEVVGLFVEWVFVFFGRGQRTVENRSVVAGKQDGSPVVASDGLVELKLGSDRGIQLFAENAAISSWAIARNEATVRP
jgi:hypothetical protein